MGIEPELPSHPQPLASATQLPMLNILVVEDNLTNQKVIMRQLQFCGYHPDAVATGQAALDAIVQRCYDIVFMDCCLPEMNGYTATRLIRQREQQLNRNRSIIIALTASDDPRIKEEAIAAGMNDFLTKPLRREVLAATLNRWNQYLRQTSPSAQLLMAVNEEQPIFPDYRSSLWELHFDLIQLHQLSDHNPEFEQELLQLYHADTQDQLQQLQQAHSKLNFQHIERIAHHIKGASASVGAKMLTEIAEQLEHHAKQQQLDQVDYSMQQLNQAFNQLQALFSSSDQSISNN
ncbi:response regulator [Leptolyngbya sp. NK1-12]|uniref:Response regulator n=1 Tax=Leptolyngbya sp. NK1-12 TaxID=2547451 RepID=A0AA96WLX0_9CYAN|nr:response regulator [Leptolyngbya sp. NK1-12]